MHNAGYAAKLANQLARSYQVDSESHLEVHEILIWVKRSDIL